MGRRVVLWAGTPVTLDPAGGGPRPFYRESSAVAAVQPAPVLRDRPPFAPSVRAAAAFAGDRDWPARPGAFGHVALHAEHAGHEARQRDLHDHRRL
jgi:hypothetical protein